MSHCLVTHLIEVYYTSFCLNCLMMIYTLNLESVYHVKIDNTR